MLLGNACGMGLTVWNLLTSVLRDGKHYKRWRLAVQACKVTLCGASVTSCMYLSELLPPSVC